MLELSCKCKRKFLSRTKKKKKKKEKEEKKKKEKKEGSRSNIRISKNPIGRIKIYKIQRWNVDFLIPVSL